MAQRADANTINQKFKGKDILSLDQFSPKDISLLFKKTDRMKIIAKNAKPSDLLKGKIVSLIFYEPSSRTFNSHAAAVKQLGGSTIEVLDPQHFSSVSKGETLEDTIRVFEAYSDMIIIRHPVVGTAKKSADAAEFVPIINAGDGIGEHPTQALLDLYTIHERFGKLNNLTGVMAGDMLNGRTVHSLLRGLSKYRGNKIYLLSPKELKLPLDLVDQLKEKIEMIEISSEKDLPTDAHFWYWTRVQKERFKSLKDYEKVKNTFILNNKLITKKANKKTIFMHPLPRVGEILEEVDLNPNALYLKNETRNGMYVRMALIALVLGK